MWVTPVAAYWHGLLLQGADGPPPGGALWVRIPVLKGQMSRLAGRGALPQGAALDQFTEDLLQAQGAKTVELRDSKRGGLWVMSTLGGRLPAGLRLAPTREVLPTAEVFAPPARRAYCARLASTCSRAAWWAIRRANASAPASARLRSGAPL